MQKEEIYDYCVNKLNMKSVKMDEPMSKHTSFKIGGNADVFVNIESIDELKSIIEFTKANGINLTIVGNGSNLLVKDNGIRGVVAKLVFKNIRINKVSENEARVVAEAGVLLGMLAQKLAGENISGFEFAAGIPGTIGGAVRMNAGAYGGEFKDIVVNTKCMDKNGNMYVLSNDDQDFSYRHSIFRDKELIVLETELLLKVESDDTEIRRKMNEYLESRKDKQPLNFPSAGSTFKRGDDFITAKLIDECGLRGYTVGGAKVSEKHAGFVINTGDATAEDVLSLCNYIKEKVFEKFGKKIELEIEILGE